MAKKQSRHARASFDLSTTLRNAASRLDSWKQERSAIAADLKAVVAAATRLLTDLGPDVPAAGAVGVDPQAKRKGGRPKGYKMSAATRRKLREAWKRRKAAAKDVK